jgi:hypothetical protein
MSCTHGNLGDRGQNNRMRMGIFGLVVGLTLTVIMIRADVAPIYRTLVFFPFFGAAFGAYQGLYRTCTFAAKQGVRETELGIEPVANPAERERARADGRRIVFNSFATAAAATALCFFIG